MPTNARVDQWAQQLDFAGLERRHGLPAGILTNLVYQESRGNPNAHSPAGAHGLAQFMPATARQYGVNVNDPQSSINGAARYLEDMLDMFNGDVDKAIAAYNAGPGGVRRAVRRAGANGDWRDFLPNETQGYLRIVGEGVGSTYAQRAARGEEIPQADRDAEEERRRSRLREAGLGEDTVRSLGGDDLLGLLFFALVRNFVEERVSGVTGGGPDVRTTREERVTEMGEGNVARAEQIQARDAAASVGQRLPVSEASPAEDRTPTPAPTSPQSQPQRSSPN